MYLEKDSGGDSSSSSSSEDSDDETGRELQKISVDTKACLCIVCNKPVFGYHHCVSCSKYCHLGCGRRDTGCTAKTLLCLNCVNKPETRNCYFEGCNSPCFHACHICHNFVCDPHFDECCTDDRSRRVSRRGAGEQDGPVADTADEAISINKGGSQVN